MRTQIMPMRMAQTRPKLSAYLSARTERIWEGCEGEAYKDGSDPEAADGAEGQGGEYELLGQMAEWEWDTNLRTDISIW